MINEAVVALRKRRFPGEAILGRLVRKALAICGYELTTVHCFGVNPFRDVASMYGNRLPRIVFDVGANEGQTALAAAAVYGRAEIHSFEPLQSTFSKLRENVRSCARIRTVNCALGHKSGSMPLYVNACSQTNSLLGNAADAEELQPKGTSAPQRVVDVEVRTIDGYCEDNDIMCIDLLKIDAQGYDLEVLRGASGLLVAGGIRFILTEVLFVPLYDGQAEFDHIYRFLRIHGYDLIALYDLRYTPHRTLGWCDALFCKRDSN